VAERQTRNAGWRGYLAARVWPLVVMAWLIPASLSFLFVRILDQGYLRWLLTPAVALAPVVTWWIRGRGREPIAGFLAIYWLLIMIQVIIERTGITVSDIIAEFLGGTFYGHLLANVGVALQAALASIVKDWGRR
jgi:hypothetical protein